MLIPPNVAFSSLHRTFARPLLIKSDASSVSLGFSADSFTLQGLRFGSTDALVGVERVFAGNPKLQESLRAYANNEASFIQVHKPTDFTDIINLKPEQTFAILQARLGAEKVQAALKPTETTDSPLKGTSSPDWIHNSGIVGVHPRICKTFLGMVNYAMTLPKWQDTLHLLPLLNAGDALYAPLNWQINTEFFDDSLESKYPELNTPNKQLKVAINLMHLMDKKVLMDVVTHMERAADSVFAFPGLFEWLKVKEDKVVNWDTRKLEEQVKEAIAAHSQVSKDQIYSEIEIPAPKEAHAVWESEEARRVGEIFTEQTVEGKSDERLYLTENALLGNGLYTTPKTIEPSHHRPLQLVNGLNSKKWVDSDGWGLNPERSDEKVKPVKTFNIISPFKWYELNEDGTPNLGNPFKPAWDYFNAHWQHLIEEFNLDGIRADMASTDYHNQENEVVNKAYLHDAGELKRQADNLETDDYYDPFRYVVMNARKNQEAAQKRPYFAFYAESPFPKAHTIRQKPNVTLDYLEVIAPENYQKLVDRVVNQEVFAKATDIYPLRTLMTTDSDTNESDLQIHTLSNETFNQAKWFLGTFMPPHYVGMGFESTGTRRGSEGENGPLYTHDWNNEAHNKTSEINGDFQWGDNQPVLNYVQRLRSFLDAQERAPLVDLLRTGQVNILNEAAFHPQIDGQQGTDPVLAWTLSEKPQPIEEPQPEESQIKDPQYLMTVNMNPFDSANVSIPGGLTLLFSTNAEGTSEVGSLQPGEGRIYKIRDSKTT